MEIKYHAVILGKKDVAETDRLYFAYSQQEGRVILLGKGTRKQGAKLAGGLEPVTLSEIFISKNRGQGRITGVDPIAYFESIKENHSALTRVFGVFAILQKMIPEKEKDERIFASLVSYLDLMEMISSQKKDANQEIDLKFDLLGQAFLWKLLGFLGYKIDTGRCVSCQEKLQEEKNYFDSRSGGVVCGNCHLSFGQGKIGLSPGVIKLWRIFWTNDLKNILKIRVSKKDIENLKLVTGDFLGWVKS